MRSDNKVVFCTGGAGTICSAQVRAMIHLGANACIIGRNVKKTEDMARDLETARSGSKVIGIGAVDVRKVEDLEAAATRCVKELGSIDFVIAGAAGNFLAPINALSANAFKTVIDIDLLGSFNCIKATMPYLLESAKKHKVDGKTRPTSGTGGRIIFVSATMHYTGTPLQAAPSAAKAGVDQLAYSLCIEHGPFGVTSNVISPGPIANTEGMLRLATKEGSDPSRIAHIPSGRWGYVKEIADATVYLCKSCPIFIFVTELTVRIVSDTGNYVNGEILVVDGGSWHNHLQPGTGSFQYPDFLLSGRNVTGVKGSKTSKI
jgi:peroxisomal 2,4-dienoyl-CoA reductase